MVEFNLRLQAFELLGHVVRVSRHYNQRNPALLTSFAAMQHTARGGWHLAPPRGPHVERREGAGGRSEPEADGVDAAAQAVDAAVSALDFDAALAQAVALKPVIDGFFDAVMVNADEPALRKARLGLVRRVADLFLAVADFRRIATDRPSSNAAPLEDK